MGKLHDDSQNAERGHAAAIVLIGDCFTPQYMTTRIDDHNVRPRMRLLPPLSALKVFVSSMNGRNAPVTISASKEQIAGIKRQSKRADSPGAALVSFLQAGIAPGRRVIFVHGTPGNARGWADYLLAVPEGHEYIALDRPGYGLSEPEHAVVSLEHQAQAIAPFLKTNRGRKTILVGHSSGGSVAMQTALDYPERVGGMLLLAGAFDPELEEAVWLQVIGRLKPVSKLLPRAINNANQELLFLKRGLLAQADRLHEISMPVEVVRSIPVEGPFGPTEGWLVSIGVPHFVVPLDSKPEGSIDEVCRKIRHDPALGPEGAAQSDFVAPLRHVGQHDVHDSNPPNDQRDAGDQNTDGKEHQLHVASLLEQFQRNDDRGVVQLRMLGGQQVLDQFC